MEITEVMTILLPIAGMFLWSRSESNADRREANADRRETRALIDAIHQEIKDFHGRLCAIEERRKGE